MTSAPLTSAALSSGLSPRRVGRRIVCVTEVASTNDAAFDLAARHGGDADGLALFAEMQTAGRGRLGRRWHAHPGAGILCSVVLTHLPDGMPPGHLALLIGVAVCRAVLDSAGLEAHLRWPNDVFIRGRKIAGVLVERRSPAGSPGPVTVVGIGINCLQRPQDFDPAIADRATSLQQESTAPVDRAQVARSLLIALDDALGGAFDKPALDAMMQEWKRLSDDVGTWVSVKIAGQLYTGCIQDVDPVAGLLLALPNGTFVFCPAETSSVVQRHPRQPDDVDVRPG